MAGLQSVIKMKLIKDRDKQPHTHTQNNIQQKGEKSIKLLVQRWCFGASGGGSLRLIATDKETRTCKGSKSAIEPSIQSSSCTRLSWTQSYSFHLLLTCRPADSIRRLYSQQQQQRWWWLIHRWVINIRIHVGWPAGQADGRTDSSHGGDKKGQAT